MIPGYPPGYMPPPNMGGLELAPGAGSTGAFPPPQQTTPSASSGTGRSSTAPLLSIIFGQGLLGQNTGGGTLGAGSGSTGGVMAGQPPDRFPPPAIQPLGNTMLPGWAGYLQWLRSLRSQPMMQGGPVRA